MVGPYIHTYLTKTTTQLQKRQDPSSRFYPGKDGRKYEALIAQGVAIPLCESLKDVRARAVQHWEVRATFCLMCVWVWKGGSV